MNEWDARSVDLPLLGIPIRFESSVAELLDVVEEVFGVWPGLLAGRPDLVQDRWVRLRLEVDEDAGVDAGGEAAPRGPAPAVRYRLSGPHRLLVETAGGGGYADRETDEGRLRVSPALLARGAAFRRDVLSALAFFLTTGPDRDRRAVHAALVASRAAGVLLHGPSGSGKSTLAVAAHLRGLRVLAEDAAYVQLEPTFRVWGAPGPAHVPPRSLALLPGAEPAGRRTLAGGEEKVVVPLPPAEPPSPPVVERAGICFLEPSRGAPALEAAPRDAVVRAVGDPREPGFDLLRGEMDAVVEALAPGGAWRLRVGDDPLAAAALLEEALARVGG